ncbi:MAG: DUF5683 domain-containing protein [candidate division Zixibacteria bacterium]|nr:DUF5683 domain-containing protein [candidate division Zixibacteria bacterium]
MRRLILLLILLILVWFTPSFAQFKEDISPVNPKKPVMVGDSLIILPKKSPFGALVRSVALPGWGQFYNKQPLKGSLIFATETTLLVAVAVEWKRRDEHLKTFNQLPLDSPDKSWEFELYQFHRDNRNLFLWSLAGVVFYSMMDAYVDAHLFNFKQDQVKDADLTLVPQVKEKEVGIILSVNF